MKKLLFLIFTIFFCLQTHAQLSCRTVSGRSHLDVLFPDILTAEVRALNSAQGKLESEITKLEALYKKESDKGSAARPYRMTKKEREQIPSQIAELQAKIAEMNSQRFAITEKEKPDLIRRLGKSIKNPVAAQTSFDYVNYLALTRVNPKSMVSLLSGHSEGLPTDKQHSEVLKLAQNLKDQGYLVVFDGDAMTASDISKVLGARGVAITGNPLRKAEGSEKMLFIDNAYIRLQAFSRAGMVVTTPDSPVGLGILINTKTIKDQKPKRLILDVNSEWKGNLAEFQKSITERKPDLGIQYETDIPKSSDTAAAMKSTFEKSLEVPAESVPTLEWRDLTHAELTAVFEASESMAQGTERLRGQKGAVLFGSAKLDPNSTQLVYKSGRILGENGVPVRTGGAGGAMWAANMGAWDAGGFSIGIPIVGKKTLANEQSFPIQAHTQTLGTPDYTIRIPLLIQNIELVGFVPGGMGTMKELAAVLVAMEARPDQRPELLFIQIETYYKFLSGLLTEDFIAPFIRERVRNAEDAKQVEAQVKQLVKFRQLTPNVKEPKTRSRRKMFPPMEISRAMKKLMQTSSAD